MSTPIAPAGTDEWHRLRRTGIGASEAAAACGLSRWKTPLHVWASKVHGEETRETAPMRLGTLMEPVILSEFQRETGLTVQPSPGLYRHPEIDWMLASPDGRIDQWTLCEFKNTTSRNVDLGETGTDQVPFEWLCQAQQQMAVCDADTVLFGVLVDGHEFRQYTVTRDERVIDGLAAREAVLWDLVQRCEPPPLDPNHGHALAAAQAAFRRIAGGLTIDLSAAACESAERLRGVKREIKTLEAQEKAEKAFLLAELGEAEFGRLMNGDLVKRTLVSRKAFTVEATSYVTLNLPKEK